MKVWCEGNDFTLLAETVNVSSTGLFVRTSNPPPSSEQLRVTIEELTVVARVEVMWSRTGRGGMGLRILGFEQGGSEYKLFLDKHRSGEHRAPVSIPVRTLDDSGDPDES